MKKSWLPWQFWRILSFLIVQFQKFFYSKNVQGGSRDRHPQKQPEFEEFEPFLDPSNFCARSSSYWRLTVESIRFITLMIYYQLRPSRRLALRRFFLIDYSLNFSVSLQGLVNGWLLLQRFRRSQRMFRNMAAWKTHLTKHHHSSKARRYLTKK